MYYCCLPTHYFKVVINKPRTPYIDSAHIPTKSDQQSATRNHSIKGCRNSLPPKYSHRKCLKHREKVRQHKKRVRAPMKLTRDDAELSDAFTEVLWTPLKHIGCTRMHRENTRSMKCPKVCYLFTQHIIQGSFTTIG